MTTFNRFTYEIQIHSIDSHYICMLLAEVSEEEAKQTAKALIQMVPQWHRLDIKNLKTSQSFSYDNKNK
jgi:hypothetical protein